MDNDFLSQLEEILKGGGLADPDAIQKRAKEMHIDGDCPYCRQVKAKLPNGRYICANPKCHSKGR